jgi:hypothetical protein
VEAMAIACTASSVNRMTPTTVANTHRFPRTSPTLRPPHRSARGAQQPSPPARSRRGEEDQARTTSSRIPARIRSRAGGRERSGPDGRI